MSTINRSSIPNLLVEGIKHNFGMGYDMYDKNFLKIFDLETSLKEVEQYQEIKSFGNHAEKPEGANSAFQTIAQSTKTYIENKTYSLIYEVTHEALSDNLYPKVLKDALELGTSAGCTMETLAMNRLNTAFSTAAADVLASGVALCSASHPVAAGGTFSNLAATPAALSETSLIAAQTAIGKFVDPAGNNINVKGDLLVVPVDTDVQAQKLLFSTLTVGSANNDLNPFGRSYGRLPKGYTSSSYLTDTNAFFIRTNVKGLVFQEREKPRVMEDFKINNLANQVTSFFRCGVGAYDPRSIFGNAGA